MLMQLIWNRAAIALRKRRLEKAQKVVDGECIRRMAPYVPVAKSWYRNHGKLRKSVQNPEPGRIIYTAPFARHDYYATVDHLHHGGNPMAKRLWLEYMKSKDLDKIGAKAAKTAGARYLRG